MFGLIRCKSLQLISTCKGNVGDSVTHLLTCGRSALLVSSRLFSYVEDDKRKDGDSKRSFVVSYLVNSYGFSPEAAESFSNKRRIKLVSPERLDSVLSFLKNHGFSQTDITKIVRSYPYILLSKVDIFLLPKFSFFRSIGFSDDEIVKLFTSNPIIFQTSLNNRLIPWYNFLKRVLGQDDMVTRYLKCSPYMLNFDPQFDIAPKFLALKETGVPQVLVLRLLRYQHRAFSMSNEKFDEIVEKIVGMGFDPGMGKFVTAFEVFQMKKSTLERRVEVYKEWGWSEDEIWSMFKKNPNCLRMSEKLIRSKLDFLLNEMCLTIQDIARRSTILNYSLEKRIVPWCSVVRVLQSKGLIKQENPVCLVLTSNDRFLRYFVKKYQDEVPELLDVYHGKTSLQQLSLVFEQKPELPV